MHGLNETASALLGKFNRRCSEAAVVLLFAAVGPRHQLTLPLTLPLTRHQLTLTLTLTLPLTVTLTPSASR